MSKMKIGIDGADVQTFVLRSPAYSEVEITRHPSYKQPPEVEFTWHVRPLGESYQKALFGIASTHFNSVEAAQGFAHDLLGLMDEAAEHRKNHREAVNKVWSKIGTTEKERRAREESQGRRW